MSHKLTGKKRKTIGDDDEEYEEMEVLDDQASFDPASWTVAELKNECKKRRLTVSGTKDTLIQRLVEYCKKTGEGGGSGRKKKKIATEKLKETQENELEYIGESHWLDIIIEEEIIAFYRLITDETLNGPAGELKKLRNYNIVSTCKLDYEELDVFCPATSTHVYLINKMGVIQAEVRFKRSASFMDCLSCKKLWKIRIEEIKTKGKDHVRIVRSIDIPYLEYLIKNGLSIPGRMEITTACVSHLENKAIKSGNAAAAAAGALEGPPGLPETIEIDSEDIFPSYLTLEAARATKYNYWDPKNHFLEPTKSNVLFISETPEKQPNGMNVQLYNYQLDCLTWMKSIETQENKFKFSECIHINEIFDSLTYKSQLLLDPSRNRFYLEEHDHLATLHTRGGLFSLPSFLFFSPFPPFTLISFFLSFILLLFILLELSFPPLSPPFFPSFPPLPSFYCSFILLEVSFSSFPFPFVLSSFFLSSTLPSLLPHASFFFLSLYLFPCLVSPFLSPSFTRRPFLYFIPFLFIPSYSLLPFLPPSPSTQSLFSWFLLLLLLRLAFLQEND